MTGTRDRRSDAGPHPGRLTVLGAGITLAGVFRIGAAGALRQIMVSSIDPERMRLSDSGTEGVLVGFRCGDCGVRVFGPATFCQACTSGNLTQVEFGTTGKLFSFTVVRVPPAGWTGPVPYILGEVELEEGPHVLAEVVDAGEAELTMGMSLELSWQVVTSGGEEKAVYKWRPAVDTADGKVE